MSLERIDTEIASLYTSLAILTIGIYAAVAADDPEVMRTQLRKAAVSAQAVFPEPYHSILMEKIGVNPFRDEVEATRPQYYGT